MYCRIVRTKTNPTKIEETYRRFGETVLSAIKKQPGFAGITGITNRTTGDTVTVTYWENEKTMKDAEPQVMPIAQKYMQSIGAEMVSMDDCEVLVLERYQPSRTGAFTRLTSAQADAAGLDELLRTYKEKALPLIKGKKGCRTAFFFANRQTGRGFAGSTWDTQKDLENNESTVTGIRQEALKHTSGGAPKVEVFEILLTEIPAGTPASR